MKMKGISLTLCMTAYLSSVERRPHIIIRYLQLKLRTNKSNIKKRKNRRYLLLALSIFIMIWLFDFGIKFENDGNTLSFIQFKINPIDYVLEYHYKDNKRISKASRLKNTFDLTYYDSTGKKTKRVKGNEDKPPIIRTTYHSNGKVLSLMPLKDTIRHGTQEIFDINGELLKTREHKNGQLIKEANIGHNQIYYYPYITASKIKEENAIEYNFDVSHVKVQKYLSSKLHYDFTSDTTQYYRPSFTEIIDSSKFQAKFKLDSTMLELKQIYGYLELDTMTQPGFGLYIDEIIE